MHSECVLRATENDDVCYYALEWYMLKVSFGKTTIETSARNANQNTNTFVLVDR